MIFTTVLSDLNYNGVNLAFPIFKFSLFWGDFLCLKGAFRLNAILLFFSSLKAAIVNICVVCDGLGGGDKCFSAVSLIYPEFQCLSADCFGFTAHSFTVLLQSHHSHHLHFSSKALNPPGSATNDS